MSAPAILVHIRNYASAGLLAALGGLISFPILIHNLTVEQYGILGLVTTTLTLFVALGKLGAQHAIIRFYAEVTSGNNGFSVQQLYATVLLLFAALAAITAVVWLVSGFLVFPRFLNYEQPEVLFVASTGILFSMLFGSAIVNFLRAGQRSGIVSVVQVLHRYLQLTFILLLLFFQALDPLSILLALFVTELVAASYAFYHFSKNQKNKMSMFSTGAFSSDLAKMLLIYGIPLMVLESLGLILRASDRYIIESLLGTAKLGQYSASYNLVSYLELVIIAGVMQPIRPMYTELWETQGESVTRRFLSDGLYYYLVIGFPLITVFSLAAPHLLNLLSSPEYEAGTIVIPFVAISFYLEGAILFLAAGLYLQKKTRPLMLWGLLATVVNLVLNFLVIPKYELLGASVVTVVSYVIFCAGVRYSAFKSVAFPLDLKPVILSMVLCVLVYAVVNQIDLDSDFIEMCLKGAISGVVLAIGLYYLDKRSAAFVLQKLGPLAPWINR